MYMYDSPIFIENRQYSRKSPVLYRRFSACYLLILPSNFPKIIHAHIPRDILSRRLFAAGSRCSSNTIPPQLAQYAVIDIIRSGSQSGSRCGGSVVGEQRHVAADVHRLTFLPSFRLCGLRCCGLGSLEPVQPLFLDSCRIINIALVHVHIAGDAIDLARTGLLPDAVLSVVGGLIHAVVCHPDSVPCPQFLGNAVFQMCLAGVDSRKIARLFYGFQKRLCNGSAGCLAFCKHAGLLDVKIDRILKCFALDDVQADGSFLFGFCRRGGVAVPVCTHRHTVGLAAGIIVFKLRVFLRCLLAIACTDNGELHAVCLDVRPVHIALMLRYIDSFHTLTHLFLSIVTIRLLS